MGVYSVEMIGSDEIGEYFDSKAAKFEELSGIEMTGVLFSSPQDISKKSNYHDIKVAFSKYCEEVFNLKSSFSEDYIILGVTTLYMGMGAPLPDFLIKQIDFIIEHGDLSDWDSPYERKAALDDFKDAVHLYDCKTPIFEYNPSSSKRMNEKNCVVGYWYKNS